VAVQFMQYCAACWLAIALQFFFTNIFTQYMHYLLANVLAIGITAVMNYLINHAGRSRHASRRFAVVKEVASGL